MSDTKDLRLSNQVTFESTWLIPYLIVGDEHSCHDPLEGAWWEQ